MAAEPVRLSRLATVAARTQTVAIVGDDPWLTDLDHDSRRVGPGIGFLAVPGSAADGHDFADVAIARGAPALVVERQLDVAAPQLVVEAVRPLMAALAAEVHGHPSAALTVVGVTGTNGKTTVTHMLEAIIVAAGRGAGLIGTIGARIAGRAVPLGHTTPEAPELQRLLHRMVDAGVDIVAMEVSSHALALGRADEVAFDVAVFTNLSQDHLDFHRDMERYYTAKRSLFVPERAGRAVVNVDDPWGARLASEVTVPVTTVGFAPNADLWGTDLAAGPSGTTMTVSDAHVSFVVTTRLAGRFNAANALIAAAAAIAVGVDPDAVRAGFEAMPAVPGRFEPVDAGQPFSVIVDYAHTPDAMAAVVGAVRPLTANRVIALGGAGGDRDRRKRPLMGRALATADIAIVTSDNPRSEDPAEIVAEVAAGAGEAAEVVIEVDRRAAIARAIELARPDDIVLILGKGHESGQQIGAENLPFDDRSVATEELRRRFGEDLA